MRLGSFAFRRGIGRRTGDHQDAYMVAFLHPGTDGLERGHHLGVQGVEFVRAVNGHAGEKSDICIVADGVEVDFHHIARWRVHERTEQTLLLDVIAQPQ